MWILWLVRTLVFLCCFRGLLGLMILCILVGLFGVLFTVVVTIFVLCGCLVLIWSDCGLVWFGGCCIAIAVFGLCSLVLYACLRCVRLVVLLLVVVGDGTWWFGVWWCCWL